MFISCLPACLPLSPAGDADLVTETDKKCEELILGRIREAFPDHKFIGEEGSAAQVGHCTEPRDCTLKCQVSVQHSARLLASVTPSQPLHEFKGDCLLLTLTPPASPVPACRGSQMSSPMPPPGWSTPWMVRRWQECMHFLVCLPRLASSLPPRMASGLLGVSSPSLTDPHL